MSEDSSNAPNEAFLPADPVASNAHADAAIAAAAVGHVVADDTGGLTIDGMHLNRKRNRELPDEEQDKIHEALFEHVAKLARRVQTMETALTAVHTAAQPFASTAVVAPVPVEAPRTDATPAERTATPRAQPLVALAPTHPNACLNDVRLNVETWAKQLTLAAGEIRNCPSDSDFPHRCRWENAVVPPTLWVETYPRKFNLAVTLTRRIGGQSVVYKDEAHLLYHANALLPRDKPKPTELRFTCYLLYGSATDGNVFKNRPKTSRDAPLFKHADSCLVSYNGKHVQSFFHHEDGKAPIAAYNATLSNGRVVFKDLAFSPRMLSSAVCDGDGSWRLCIRSTHPALTHLVNFCTLTPVFYTGRRVRSVKPKRDKEKESSDGEEEQN